MNPSRPLRIAHVTLGLQLGGQEKLLVEFARHADRSRFDLEVVALTDRGVLADTLEDLDCPVTALHAGDGLRPGLVLRLRRWFQERRIDIVHSHDDKPLLYSSLATRFTAVRRYLHTHHHGKIGYISRRQEFLVGLASRLTHRFVCVSHDCARQMIHQGVAAKKIATLWNGIDTTRFDYRGPTVEGPVVIVARLSPEKDIPTLLRAASLVAAADPAFRLEIAGTGPCRDELQQLASELRLGDRVTFLGPVTDVPALLSRASLFVLSSLTEGISLTLLEAQARGLPVVVTRVGGNPEVVVDGTGLMIPSRDPAALAEAILQVRGFADRGRAMGLAGRTRIEKHFDIRAMVANYERLYLDGLHRRTPRPAHEVSV